MLELYLFISATLLTTLIILRRQWISERIRKMRFKREVSSTVDQLKKEEHSSSEKRFRDHFSEEQKSHKFDIAKYKDALRKADMKIAKKQWKAAKTLLIQALALAKDELPASRRLAKVYLESGEWRRAESLYSQLTELDPENPEIYRNLAKIASQKKRYKEAIGHFVKVVELDEKDDFSLLHLGKLYQLLMRPGLAAECFRRAAELKPREVEYLFLLAETCGADEDFDNALYTYEKILTVEPYNEKAATAAQEVRMKMKETEVVIKQIVQKQKETPIS